VSNQHLDRKEGAGPLLQTPGTIFGPRLLDQYCINISQTGADFELYLYSDLRILKVTCFRKEKYTHFTV